MKAIILAAGRGERMNSSLPKPLHKVLGLSLIERVIIPLLKAGIKEIIVVLGYKGEEIENYLKKKFKDKKINFQFVYNNDYEKGNGASFLLALKRLKADEPFLLLMADHIYSPTIIERLLKEKDSFIVVNQNFSLIKDLAEETKVKINNGYLVAIGKDLKDFDGVDGGIFLLRKKDWQLNKKEGELCLIIKEYLKKEKIKPFYLKKDEYVFNINDQESKKWASNYLLNHCGKKEDGIISRNINRKISKLFTQFLINLNCSPLTFTIINFLLTILAAFSFFFSNILGAFLVQLVSIFDGVDGEIARLKLATTKFGAYLDAILDRYGDTIIMLSLAFAHYLKTNQDLIFFWTIWAILGSNMSMILKEKEKLLFSYSFTNPLLPPSRDLRLFLIFLFGIFNQLFPLVIFLAIFTNLGVLIRLLLVKRFAKED